MYIAFHVSGAAFNSIEQMEKAPRRQRMTRAEAGRLNSAQRRIVEHWCPVCGKVYQAIKTSRYCSVVCQMRAYRRRKKHRQAPIWGGLHSALKRHGSVHVVTQKTERTR